MILDERNEFFDGLAIPAAGTALAGDVIDLQALGGAAAGLGGLRDVGNGRSVFWYVSVGDAAAGGTSVNAQLITDDNSAMSSPAIIAQTGVVPLASLTSGSQLVMLELPTEGVAYQRYLGVQLVVVGTFTDGDLTSGLTLDKHGWKPYAEAVS